MLQWKCQSMHFATVFSVSCCSKRAYGLGVGSALLLARLSISPPKRSFLAVGARKFSATGHQDAHKIFSVNMSSSHISLGFEQYFQHWTRFFECSLDVQRVVRVSEKLISKLKKKFWTSQESLRPFEQLSVVSKAS